MWIIFVIILIYLFGAPSSINIPGFGWDLNKQNNEPIIINQPITSKVNEGDLIEKELKIESLKPRKDIYAPSETAYVDVRVKNDLKVEYNITVEWFNNDKRYKGWFNKSTETYGVNIINNEYWSSYGSLNRGGEWLVQVTIEYMLNNKTISKGSTTSFKVI